MALQAEHSTLDHKSHNMNNNETGVTKGAKGVTSTLGNTVRLTTDEESHRIIDAPSQVGGLTNTVGGVVGAAGRGLGETVGSATGGAGKDVGKGIADVGNGLEDGAANVAKSAENAGEWKS